MLPIDHLVVYRFTVLPTFPVTDIRVTVRDSYVQRGTSVRLDVCTVNIVDHEARLIVPHHDTDDQQCAHPPAHR